MRRGRTTSYVFIGKTPWARRWVQITERLEAATPYRLERGRAMARQRAVEGPTVRPGGLEAVVRDRNVLDVTMTVPTLSEQDWNRVVEALSRELRFGAELASGRASDDMEAAIAGLDVALFPEPSEVTTSCPCVDDAATCKHAAAVAYAFAEELDHDPGLLLRLRGRELSRVLDDLRGARSGAESARAERAGVDPTDLDPDTFLRARGDLNQIRVHPAPTNDPAHLLHRLGAPPGIEDAIVLERLVQKAADTAWRLAAGHGAEVADEEVLLAELRAQRMATAAVVAAAAGWDRDKARETLDRLYAEGVIMKTGKDEAARYRA